MHDKKDILEDTDELILLEADTLGGLDTSRVKPTYSKDSNRKFMIGVMEKRFPKFITDYGKEEFKKVYKIREAYYNDLG